MTASEQFEFTGSERQLSELTSGSAPISIREVGELRASIPYLLGFYPERSLVVIGLAADSSICVTIRVDAPESPDAARACIEQLQPVLQRSDPHRVVVAYCDDYELGECNESEREQITLSALRAFETVSDLAPVISGALAEHGYESSFVWPARPGMPRGPLGPVPQIAVAHVLAGRTLLRSRDELKAMLAPTPGRARREVREQLAALEAVSLARIDLIALVTDLLEQHAGASELGNQPPILDPHDIALCVLALSSIPARDILITLIAQERAWWRVEPWCRAVQLAPTSYVPAAATMTAIVAYLGGDGALAQIALDRALAHDPNYSLAQMIDAGLRSGLHPRELQRVLASTFDDDPRTTMAHTDGAG